LQRNNNPLHLYSGGP